MKSIKIYPRNKEHYIKLIKFAKEVLDICKEIGIEPIAYGGLIYFGYTLDKNVVIHDIDLLVPEKYIGKISEKLKNRKIRYIWNHKRHDFKIYKDGAKVELDALENYKGKGKIKKFDFDGLKVNAVSLESLANTYKNACKESKGKHEQHLKRWKNLVALNQ